MKIINKLKTKSGMFFGIIVMFSLVVGLSYGTFIFSTGNYRSTSMLISNLLYGIDITTTGGNETINTKTVTLPSGKTSTILLKITSLNDVESKYGVSYKINSGTGSVKYSSNTGWLPTGKINKNGTGTYEKVVKIVIEATSDLSVEFNVDGGYTYNDLNSTKDGYTRVTESITGITDSPKEVYYYAGNTTNNWVKFAGFYWRIIRTNHDSSIRLLYVGTSPDTTSGNIGEGNFNSSYNSPKYVGYKYGEDTSLDTIRNNTTDSKIKTYVDNWYKNNLINYTKYLSTSAVYCNDRSLGTGQTYSTNSLFEFASYYRMDYNTNGAKANPSYNCTDRRDAFSVDNTSAKLTYPVSLMTTDEMAFAGGVAYIKTNTSYAWFISNSAGSQVSSSWWSLSPDGWNGARSCVWRWDSDNAYLNIVDVGIDDAVRPVLSLKSCIKYSTGNGSSETPYEIVETSSGC